MQMVYFVFLLNGASNETQTVSVSAAPRTMISAHMLHPVPPPNRTVVFSQGPVAGGIFS